ncbi:hypothetical protein BKA66DRAFT_585915 [Pyrenochaeta sp. MPI-SDFR-AT-0127]|nr:hypothetical protein BKA66DRAFT_585915 [Pyrenochaeta sp. MPI-SDFR-AT-0127]
MRISAALYLAIFSTAQASLEPQSQPAEGSSEALHWAPRKPYAEPAIFEQLPHLDFSPNFATGGLFQRQNTLQCYTASAQNYVCDANQSCLRWGKCNGLPAQGCCAAGESGEYAALSRAGPVLDSANAAKMAGAATCIQKNVAAMFAAKGAASAAGMCAASADIDARRQGPVSPVRRARL